MEWPTTKRELVQVQKELGRLEPPPWKPPPGSYAVGGCFVCFSRGLTGPGATGEPAWAAAVVVSGGPTIAQAIVEGVSGYPYRAGLLALREGRLLETAVRTLPSLPEVLLVNASGRDHPRNCGLAIQLGAMLALPTVGITHRPLVAQGQWPADEAGAASPLIFEGGLVGCWLRTRNGTRPLAVHAGWRTSPEVAAQVALEATIDKRTPEPIRQARELARSARAAAL